MLGLCMLLSFKSNPHCNIVWAFYAATCLDREWQERTWNVFIFRYCFNPIRFSCFILGRDTLTTKTINFFFPLVRFQSLKLLSVCNTCTHNALCAVMFCLHYFNEKSLGHEWTMCKMNYNGIYRCNVYIFPVLSSVQLHCITCNMMIFEHDLWCSVNPCGTALVSFSIHTAGIIVTVGIYFSSIRAY